jgi:hypothetical protein
MLIFYHGGFEDTEVHGAPASTGTTVTIRK